MNHVLHVPPKAPVEEPVAFLTYEGETFEIGYTLMGLIAGWIAAGARGYDGVALSGNAVAAFRHVSNCMGYDAMPPLPEEHREVYLRAGIDIGRPKFKLPNPQVTQYAEGHVPEKRKRAHE